MCRGAVVVWAFVVCAWLTGCTKPEPPLYPAGGTVKFPDGKPAAGATVEFSAAHDGRTYNARAEVDADGRFQLKTTLNGEEKDGAIVGAHKVVVVSPPYGGPGPAGDPVPVRYADYGTSGLTFEVAPGGANDYPIAVGRK